MDKTKDTLTIGQVFATLQYEPGNTLYQVLHEELPYMIHEVDEGMLECAEYTYAVDFYNRSLLVLYDDRWIDIPLIRPRDMSLIFRLYKKFDLKNNRKKTRNSIKKGPSYLSRCRKLYSK
jgi:hypothetical protein